MRQTLLRPGIRFFNRLRFKYKIIAIFSLFFVPVLIFSLYFIQVKLHEAQIARKQVTALGEIRMLHRIFTQMQLHRGMLNLYLNGNEAVRPEIIQNERHIMQLVRTDLQHSDNPLLAESLDLIRRYSVKHPFNLHDSRTIFAAQNRLISRLLSAIREIAERNRLTMTDDTMRNHLAEIMTGDLLKLQEMTGQFRGQSSPLVAKKQMTYEERATLLKHYTYISALTQNPLENSFQAAIYHRFSDLASIRKLLGYQLENVFAIVRKQLIDPQQTERFKANRFFHMLSDVIDTETGLFEAFTDHYHDQLQKDLERLHREIGYILLGLFAMLSLLFYVGAAFYRSVLTGIRQLRHASEAIRRGETQLHLTTTREDEIASTLHAFNRMSDTLHRNLSFLHDYKFSIDSSSIVSKTDRHGIITYVNDTFCSISGYTKEELIGASHNIVRHPEMPKETFRKMWQTIKSGEIWRGILKNRTRSGGFYIVDATIVPIRDHHGKIVEYIGIRHDVTQLEASKARIEDEMRKQKIDPLTGLPRRVQLLQDLASAKEPVLFYLDIDDFSGLNDFYGTATGDKVLKFVADLLQNALRSCRHHLYKLHSDGFVILCEQADLETAPETFLEALIDRIEEETQRCDNHECVSITLTGSIADYRICRERNFSELVTALIRARKDAKAAHKKFLFYSDAEEQTHLYEKHILWINKIKEALEEDRILPFYQPIVDTASGEIHKYEALVRLIEPDGSVVSPFFFLDIAKKAKLYTRITKRVIRHSFEMFHDRPDLEFSVNISVEDILDEEIAAYILEKIEAFPQPRRIILEITETEEIQDYDPVNRFIGKAKAHGVRIAIDDFGSGYSNFEHIIGLHADFIKIDGSLVKHIDQSEESRIITEAIIAFSHKLGARTIAEFVHSEAVKRSVIEMGADYMQGYLLGEPSPELVEAAVAR